MVPMAALLRTNRLLAGTPPNVIVAPAAKPVPSMKTRWPTNPSLGSMLVRTSEPGIGDGAFIRSLHAADRSRALAATGSHREGGRMRHLRDLCLRPARWEAAPFYLCKRENWSGWSRRQQKKPLRRGII